MHLTVINSTEKVKPNYHALYSEAYMNCLERAIDANKLIPDINTNERKKMVYYGIKMLNAQKKDASNYEYLMNMLNQSDFIKAVISTLTPDEFENIFPIEKTYDGERFGIKDYFFVKKSLDIIGREIEIGHNVEKLMWDYVNHDVREFNVNNLSILSDIRRHQGHKGIMEEFMESKGIMGYTLFDGEDGKKYLKNNETGDISKVKKPKPRYLNLVKKENLSS